MYDMAGCLWGTGWLPQSTVPLYANATRTAADMLYAVPFPPDESSAPRVPPRGPLVGGIVAVWCFALAGAVGVWSVVHTASAAARSHPHPRVAAALARPMGEGRDADAGRAGAPARGWRGALRGDAQLLLAWAVQPAVGLSVAIAVMVAAAPRTDWPAVAVLLLLLAALAVLVAGCVEQSCAAASAPSRVALHWGAAAVYACPVVTLILWASTVVQRSDAGVAALGCAIAVQSALALHAVFFWGLITHGKLSPAHVREVAQQLLPLRESAPEPDAPMPTAHFAARRGLAGAVYAAEGGIPVAWPEDVGPVAGGGDELDGVLSNATTDPHMLSGPPTRALRRAVHSESAFVGSLGDSAATDVL